MTASHAGPVLADDRSGIQPRAHPGASGLCVQATTSAPDDGTTVEEIRTEQALASLEPEWTDLLARSDSNLLFVTHAWVSSWWRHFGYSHDEAKPAELFVLALRQGGRLCGLAPLVLERECAYGISVRVLRFLGHGASDYSDFIVAGDREGLLTCLVRHLVARASAWDLMDLSEFYGASANLPVLRRTFAQAGLAERVEDSSLCYLTRVEGEWEAFYRSCFDGKRRKDHRREWRNLAATGPLRVDFLDSVTSEPGLTDAIAEIQREHPDAGRDRPGDFNVEVHRRFLDDFLLRAAASGWLSVALLRCDGKITAYWLGFRYAGRHYLYSTAYRREVRRLAAGKLLLMRLLEENWKSGDREIDFLRGGEAYKREWTTDSRQNLRLLIIRPRRSVRFRTWIRFVLAPHLARRNPRVHRALQLLARGELRAALRRRWPRRAAR